MRLVAVNVFLWIIAYAFNYEDGKDMFHIGYYVASFIALGTLVQLLSFRVFAELSMTWVAMTMAIYAFIVFIGKAVQRQVKKSMHYVLFVLVTLSLMFLLYHYTKDDVHVSFVMAQIFLMALYCGIFGIYRYMDRHQITPYEDSFDSLRKILSGHQVQAKRTFTWLSVEALQEIYTFLRQLDDKTK